MASRAGPFSHAASEGGGARVAPALGVLQRRHDHDAPLHDRLHHLVVHLCVACEVREAVDAGGDQPLRIGEIEDVRVDADAALVRLVDDGAIERRTQLGCAAVAVVDPDLDEVDLLCCELPHIAPAFCVRRDVVRNALVRVGARPCIRRAHAAAGREQTRAAKTSRGLVLADLERRIARIDALGDDGAHAEVERAIEVVDDCVAPIVLRAIRGAFLEAGVRVYVDERRHHRLAGEIDARGARRRFHIFCPPDADDGAVLDDEGRILDRRRAIAADQRRALVDRGLCKSGRRDEEGQAGESLHGADYSRRLAERWCHPLRSAFRLAPTASRCGATHHIPQ